MKRFLALTFAGAGLLAATGCVNVHTDAIEVKPIHITVDVNVKIDKELKSAFSDLDATDPTLTSNPNPPKQ